MPQIGDNVISRWLNQWHNVFRSDLLSSNNSPTMPKNLYCRLLTVFIVLVSTPVFAAWHSASSEIMGTRISLTFWLDDESSGITSAAVVDAVFSEMHRIDRTYSPYKPNSELSRLNQQASKASVKVSNEMVRLLDKSLYFGKLSGGAFDISYASIGYKYDYRQHQSPTQREVAQLLSAVDYRQIKLDRHGSRVYFGHSDLRIDFGGLAKGYAVDQAIDILREFGIAHATVSAGGDSRVLGDKRGKPWLIGIKKPRGGDGVAITLPLANIAVSTSGDYERYYIDEETGQRIHHIINPKTGQSASGLVSVTVLGDSGFDTDPLSTTVFVLGAEKGLQLLNSMPGFDGVLIDSSGKVLYSEGLAPP